jgi:uncharacterized membrane protein
MSSQYFATSYLPQAAGIRLAALISDRMMVHLIGARLMNCLVASGLIVLAIIIFPPAIPIIIAVSALPMSLFLISSASQDALLIAWSILLAAVCLRLMCSTEDGPKWQRPRWLAVSASTVVLLLGLGRPPYVVFAAIPAIGLVLLDWRRHTAFSIALVFAVLGLLTLHFAYLRFLDMLFVVPEADYSAQIQSIITDPTVFLRALWTALASRIPKETIGIIGWGDAPLPAEAYPVARYLFAVSVVTTVIAFANSKFRSSAMDQLYAQLVYVFISAGVVISSMLLLTLGVYLNSISVGANVVPIHGRYFVEFLPVFLCGVLTPFLADRLWVRFPRLAGSRLSGAVNCVSILLLAGMVASFATICLTIIDRYYLR